MKSIETNYRCQLLSTFKSIYLVLRTVAKTFIPSLRDVCMRQLEEDLWTDLTERQEEVLGYIVDCIEHKRMPPTRKEIADHFRMRSANGADEIVKRLVRKGCLVLIPDSSRGIMLADRC